MPSRLRSTHAEIKLSHLAHNFRTLRSLVKNPFFCPMVKANAYGHGDFQVARTLIEAGAEYLGVVLVEEGIALRTAGIEVPILVFGVFDHGSAEEALDHNLTPVLSSWAQIKAFENNLSSKSGYSVHLKFNTGMNRLGFETLEAKKLGEYFKTTDKLALKGICTHLINGEDAGKPGGSSELQIKSFKKALEFFDLTDVVVHYLNSSAILLEVDPLVGARPGIALYGVQPPTYKSVKADLLPVMSLRTTVEIIHRVSAGQSVSYGATWVAKKDSVVAVVPLGYADGYSRSFSNLGKMLIRGKKVSVTGIVCMDYTMLDVTELDQQKKIEIGEEVVVFGQQKGVSLGVEELSQIIGSISYEIITRIGARVPRVFIHDRN